MEMKCFNLDPDVWLFGLSAFLAWGSFIEFMIQQYFVQFKCLLFGTMFELKRIMIPGPTFACQFYLLSLVGIGLFASFTTYKAKIHTIYIFNTLWSKIAAASVPLVGLFNHYLLKKGLQSLCDTFDVNKLCESEVFLNTDFKAFTPKYLDAYSFFGFCERGKIYSIILCCLWISSLLIHCRKHKRLFWRT